MSEELLIEADGDEERVLCVDGGCIGLVGEDGRCRMCGLPGPGHEGAAPAGVLPDQREGAEADPCELDFDGRRLCPDGACIGVLGDDGRCPVCGRLAP